MLRNSLKSKPPQIEGREPIPKEWKEEKNWKQQGYNRTNTEGTLYFYRITVALAKERPNATTPQYGRTA